MGKVILKFKKEDFESDYINSDDCAITRALARAGYPNLRDGGGCILKVNSLADISENNSYDKMAKKVYGMYSFLNPKGWRNVVSTPTKPRDFQATIKLDI